MDQTCDTLGNKIVNVSIGLILIITFVIQNCSECARRCFQTQKHLVLLWKTSVLATFLWQLRHYNSPGLHWESEFKPPSCFVPLTQLFDLLCPQKATSHYVADFQGATSNATRPTKLKRAVLEISKEDFFLQNFESYMLFFAFWITFCKS